MTVGQNLAVLHEVIGPRPRKATRDHPVKMTSSFSAASALPELTKRFLTRALPLLLALTLGALWFGALQSRYLANPDEGRYAEIAREMAVSGDWVTPRLNGFKYFEKPPLQYWATAMAYRLFGEHEWTARLWTALTGVLSVLAIFYAGGRLFGREAGLCSPGVIEQLPVRPRWSHQYARHGRHVLYDTWAHWVSIGAAANGQHP